MSAVQAGLRLNSHDNQDRFLNVLEIKEDHLKRAYKTAPFEVKVDIAKHLKNSEELQNLSQQAFEDNKLEKAYDLWVTGDGELDTEYINGLRTSLIVDGVKNHSGYMYFLQDKDTPGNAKLQKIGWVYFLQKEKIRESGLWLVNELYKEPLTYEDIEELKNNYD